MQRQIYSKFCLLWKWQQLLLVFPDDYLIKRLYYLPSTQKYNLATVLLRDGDKNSLKLSSVVWKSCRGHQKMMRLRRQLDACYIILDNCVKEMWYFFFAFSLFFSFFYSRIKTILLLNYIYIISCITAVRRDYFLHYGTYSY